jgi:hypothetical protein
MSKRTRFWIIFTASGALAYWLVFWEAFWPLGRYIAGWYVFFVAFVLFVAAAITLSVKYGPIEYRPGLLEHLNVFTLW